MGDDPFVEVQADVVNAMKTADPLYARFNEFLTNPRIGDAKEFEWTSKQLRDCIKDIQEDVDALDETNELVRQNPAQFKITPQVLAEREGFVRRARKRLNDITASLNSPQAKVQSFNEKRNKLLGQDATKTRFAKMQEEERRQNDKFIDDVESQQQSTMDRQDETVIRIGEKVQTLKEIGNIIHDELDEQDSLLNDLDTNMDSAQGKLSATLAKVDKALALSKDKKQVCCICVLILAIILLIILYVQV
eukprot:m.662663 g.662663  ORF g.662663 m.662663 type:complete len:248 (-) comp58477_c0_seq1:5006-5749(-)